jgi:hypothetical protein
MAVIMVDMAGNLQKKGEASKTRAVSNAVSNAVSFIQSDHPGGVIERHL